jgi:hypothetical protein
MPSIVMNCAGPNELTREINDYLEDRIVHSKGTIYISLSDDEAELSQKKLGVSTEDTRKVVLIKKMEWR